MKSKYTYSILTCLIVLVSLFTTVAIELEDVASEDNLNSGDSLRPENLHKRYMDYRQSSYCDKTLNISGSEKWVYRDLGQNRPLTILIPNDTCIVQTNRTLLHLTSDGSLGWERPITLACDIFYSRNQLYYPSSSSSIESVDLLNSIVMSQMYIPGHGAKQLFIPAENNFYISQSCYKPDPDRSGFVYDEDGNPVRRVQESDKTTFLLTNGDIFTDGYRIEKSAEYLIALISESFETAIAPSVGGDILTIDLSSGDILSEIQIPDMWFQQASFTDDGTLIALVTSPSRTNSVVAIKQSYAYPSGYLLLWEYPLSEGSLDGRLQPPGIDPEGRVYFIYNDSLTVLDSGELQWSVPVEPTDYYQTFTIFKEQQVVVCAGHTVTQFDSAGNILYTQELPQDEYVTTAPATDSEGRLYWGTTKGIYCIE